MQIEGTFFFDPADGIYRDHFPGNPVVPGSLIVHAFLEAGEKAGFSGAEYTIENFRFREFISPGEYSYSIRMLPDHLKCRLYRNHRDTPKTLVTGTIRR